MVGVVSFASGEGVRAGGGRWVGGGGIGETPLAGLALLMNVLLMYFIYLFFADIWGSQVVLPEVPLLVY